MSGLEEKVDPQLLRDAAKYVIRYRDATAVGLQRRFGIGNARARTLLQVLENHGVVGARSEGTGRAILVGHRDMRHVLDTLPAVVKEPET